MTETINTLPKPQLTKLVSDCLLKAYSDLGYRTPDKKKFLEMVSIITLDIYHNFAHMTEAKIRTAFYKGSRGEYGEVAGLSAVAVYRWIKAEKHNNGRMNLADMSKKQIAPHVDTNKDYYDSLYDYVMATGKIPPSWDYKAVYEHLIDSDLMTVSSEDFDSQLEVCTLDLKHEIEMHNSDNPINFRQFNIMTARGRTRAFFVKRFMKQKCVIK